MPSECCVYLWHCPKCLQCTKSGFKHSVIKWRSSITYTNAFISYLSHKVQEAVTERQEQKKTVYQIYTLIRYKVLKTIKKPLRNAFKSLQKCRLNDTMSSNFKFVHKNCFIARDFNVIMQLRNFMKKMLTDNSFQSKSAEDSRTLHIFLPSSLIARTFNLMSPCN